MREQFEKLPRVKQRLLSVKFNINLGCYEPINPLLDDCLIVAMYLNGAWPMYQEQQKEIDGFQDEIKALILQWRSNADYANKISSEDFIENTLNECADELERILQVMHDQHLSC